MMMMITIAFIVIITVTSFVLMIFDQVSGSLLENMSEVGLFLSLCWNSLPRPGDLNLENFDRRPARLLLAPLKQCAIIHVVARCLFYFNCLKPRESREW